MDNSLDQLRQRNTREGAGLDFAALVAHAIVVWPSTVLVSGTRDIAAVLIGAGALTISYLIVERFTSQRSAVVKVIGLWLLLYFSLCMGGIVRMEQPRGEARRVQCKNNLRLIGLALQQYHDHWKSYPPVSISDESGKLMHSWRTLYLPNFDNLSVYRAYDFSKPWDAPDNRRLAQQLITDYMISCPSCKQSERGNTTYFAVTGLGTAWPGPNQSSRLEDFRKATSHIILAIEVGYPDVNWLEPRDIKLSDLADQTYVATIRQRLKCHTFDKDFFRHVEGFHVLLADGTIRALPHDVDFKLLEPYFLLDASSPSVNLNTLAVERWDASGRWIFALLQVEFVGYLVALWFSLRRGRRTAASNMTA